MRFILTEDFWALDALSPPEWHLVKRLPETAAGDGFSPDSRERLLPSPLAPDALADEESIDSLDDWKEFVRPELEDSFRQQRKTVGRDIDSATVLDQDDIPETGQWSELFPEPAEFRRVLVPRSHTETWYSVLNQARLVMNEEFGLADAEDRPAFTDTGDGDINEERLLVIAQYELYSAIQAILVENVMET